MRSIEHDWLRKQVWGCTFDDFLIRPGWGRARSRKNLSLAAKFSQNISLNIPIVSSNMNTITRARMAIAVAREGGIGILDRYPGIADQCKKAEEVKRKESHLIPEPYGISKRRTIAQAREVMAQNKVGSLVVLDRKGRLAGLLSSRDVRFADPSQLVSERMKPVEKLITARENITLAEAKKVLDDNRLEKLPLVKEDFTLAGLITSKDIKNLEKFPLANKDANGQLVVGAAIGAVGDYLERAAELIKAKVDVIVMDIANFQSDIGIKAVESFRNKFPDMELVVGNVVLPQAARTYMSMGVNGVKVGLGPGSACTTRYNTSIGVPQAQAIYECWRVAPDCPLIADGGIRRDGQMSLALLLGASSVMIGGMFAGTDETPGLVFRKSTGKLVKRFSGMASREAMYERLKAEEDNDPYETSSRLSPEGIDIEVESKGSVVPIIREMAGHLASMISYMGARSLQEAKEMFMEHPMNYLIRLSRSAKRESWDR